MSFSLLTLDLSIYLSIIGQIEGMTEDKQIRCYKTMRVQVVSHLLILYS
ncbi:hypothetical protein OnM2_c301o2 [Erysiphe neolycopersici]|uniref:Uncharacterized protein n=1 Tax=Erysiphe neolycopersici TaxID=212602 RepID=A0A420HXV4_9PEZI|nr:hypothetical protein OnM2_c301o2 [Erysiphe neolycopersici]